MYVFIIRTSLINIKNILMRYAFITEHRRYHSLALNTYMYFYIHIYTCIYTPVYCSLLHVRCFVLLYEKDINKHSALIFEESIIHCSIQERNGSNSSSYNDFGMNTWFWVSMLISIICNVSLALRCVCFKSFDEVEDGSTTKSGESSWIRKIGKSWEISGSHDSEEQFQ